MNSVDNLLGVCAFLDRHSLVQMQQTNHYLDDFVLKHFPEAPYHMLQLLEYRDANRAWILNGEVYIIRTVVRVKKSLDIYKKRKQKAQKFARFIKID